jgi:hypothetical protein
LCHRIPLSKQAENNSYTQLGWTLREFAEYKRKLVSKGLAGQVRRSNLAK